MGSNYHERGNSHAPITAGPQMPTAGGEEDPVAQRQAYASPAIDMLNSLCRIPEPGASSEMVEKVPLLLELIKKRVDGAPMQDAYECLLGMASGSDVGFSTVKEEEPLGVVATDIQLSPPDSPWLPVAVKFLTFMFNKGVDETLLYEHKNSFAAAVPALAREFAQRSDDLKFDVLSLLINMLAPFEAAEPVRMKLREVQPSNSWTADVRTGLGHILHSRVGPEQRQAALQLARVALEFESEGWLAGPITSPVDGTPLPPYRFFLLVVETLRVEVPILLEELARLVFVEEEKGKGKEKANGEKDNGSSGGLGGLSRSSSVGRPDMGGGDLRGGGLGAGGTLGGGGGLNLSRSASMNLAAYDFGAMINSADADATPAHDPWGLGTDDWDVPSVSPEVQKAQAVVAECFSVFERVIEVLAKVAAAETPDAGLEDPVSVELAATLSGEVLEKTVDAVDETISVVLEFLEQAKVHEKNEDNGVLACVRVIGRFLTEAPEAHRRRVLRLLSFMLSVRASDEEMPVQAVKFLLPALLQITCDARGCKALVKRGGYKYVIRFVQEQARTNVMGILKAGEEGHSCLVMACDVLLNVFATREEFKHTMEGPDFTPLFAAVVSWTSAKGVKGRQAVSHLAMAACVAASVLELTSEEAIKARLDLAAFKRLPKALEVVVRFLELGNKTNGDFGPGSEEKDLWDITVTSCLEALPKWPLLKRAVEKSEWWARLNRRTLTRERLVQLVKEPQLRALAAAVGGLS